MVYGCCHTGLAYLPCLRRNQDPRRHILGSLRTLSVVEGIQGGVFWANLACMYGGGDSGLVLGFL
jgi:hypothetical protein